MKSEDVISTAEGKRAGTTVPASVTVVARGKIAPKSVAVVGTVQMNIIEQRTKFANREQQIYRRSYKILGGRKFLQHQLGSKSDVHFAIVSGMPYGSLLHLVEHMEELKEVDIVKALGISARTLRRQSETPDKPMPVDLASKTWLFAEIFAKATEIFGGKEDAELWMSKPAMGLDGQRPIDLLQTVQGAELVNDFLSRLEFGVYT